MWNESGDKKRTIKSIGVFVIPVLISGVIKVWLISTGSIPFNADEAVVALMARHINQGEVPIFFYGQAYLGSLDAILVAIGFRIFGEYVWVIRAIQTLLYSGTVLTVVLLGKKILGSDKAALFCGLIAAVPPVNITLYTTVSLGGYGEVLLLGNLLLLGGMNIIRETRMEYFFQGNRRMITVLIWSVLAGFSFWVFGLSLVYSIPVVILVVWEFSRTKQYQIAGKYIMSFIGGGIVGALPWILFVFSGKGFVAFSELAGSAIAGTESTMPLLEPLNRLGNFLLLGSTVIFGLRPPWSVRWLMLPVLPFVMIFWMSAFFIGFNRIHHQQKGNGFQLINLLSVLLLLGFILSPYGRDPSGRYFLPLLIPMVIYGADFIVNRVSKTRYIQISLLTLVLLFNLGGTIQAVAKTPPGITTQFDEVTQIDHSRINELIEFLNNNNVTRGYTNYWVSYPLAFLSSENLLFIPRLPYHEDFRYTARDDRYPPYSETVQNAPDIGYITTKHEYLDQYLRDSFMSEGITWSEKSIGDYHIFYNLESDIRPADIGLGRTTNP